MEKEAKFFLSVTNSKFPLFVVSVAMTKENLALTKLYKTP